MGLADLFKSTREKEREKNRARRKAERGVENAIDRIADRIDTMEKERAKIWDKARALIASGQRAEAARQVQVYKAQGLQIGKLERARTYLQNNLAKISSAAAMKDSTSALKDLACASDFDPDTFAETLDDVADVSDDIRAMDKAMDKAFENDQKQMIAEADAVKENSVEDAELMAALEKEAAVGVMGDKVADLAAPGKEPSADDINAGRDKLKALLEKK